MTALERCCRLLLLAYPAWYRRARTDEMLGTLLEVMPGDRRWPAWREGRALVVGGLRVRSGLNQRLTIAAHVRLAVVLGLAVMLLRIAAADLTEVVIFSRHWHSAGAGIGYAVACGVLTVAVVAALFVVPPRIVAAMAAVTAGFWFWGYSYEGRGQGVLASLVLLALAAAVRGQARLPRIWLWLPAALLVPQLLVLVGSGMPGSTYLALVLPSLIVWLILGCAALWIVVDPRPAIAVAVYAGCLFAGAPAPFLFAVPLPDPWQLYAAAAAGLAAAAIWQLQHRSARRDITPPDSQQPDVADIGPAGI
jgi:hypothetical protein